jgi:hypothetical protein
MRRKETILVVCLFLFLFVVIGGGLHLSPIGALLAAVTGTPLLICVFNVWSRRSREFVDSETEHGGGGSSPEMMSSSQR